MDYLIIRVNNIRVALQACRNRLNSHRENAKTEIGGQVSEMRRALLEMDQRISKATLEIEGSLKADATKEPTKGSLDLKPNIRSLCEVVTLTISDLELAEAKATRALKVAIDYRIQILDVNQDIMVQQPIVDEAYKDVMQLKAMADKEVAESKKLVSEAQSELEQKNRDIREYAKQIKELEAGIEKYKSTLVEFNRALAAAQREADQRKGKALLGTSLALFGAAMIPVTGGLSGALIGAGGAWAYNELDELREVRAQVNGLKSRIDDSKEQIEDIKTNMEDLNDGKTDSESRLGDLKSDLNSLNITHKKHKSEASKARSVKSDVAGLIGQAKSMVLDVESLEKDLQKLKVVLNECAAVLNREAAELATEKSLLERPRPRKIMDQEREFKRDKATLIRAMDALVQTRSKMPLLISGTEMKFLKDPSIFGDVPGPVLWVAGIVLSLIFFWVG